ncbi:MAG: restriction endonuclease subunit S [bacterium]
MIVYNENRNLVRLGDYIEVCDVINVDSQDLPFCGINKDKAFMPTVADTNELDSSKYKIVKRNVFVFSGMQTGRDICIRIALYDKEDTILVSPAYTTFVVKDHLMVLPEYLFIQFYRFQMDRYGWFLSDGSVRSNLDWSVFCDIQIPLSDINTQHELVDTYNGLKALAEQNEALIKPLSEACLAYIVDCKKKYPEAELGDYIEVYDQKNIDSQNLQFCGINKNKTFMPTVADTNELDNTKYKIVVKDVFVFSGMQTGRDVCIRLALYANCEPILVSPAYTTFVLKDKSVILPHYLFIQFNRFEMDRYGWFLSDGSIRSNLDWSEFCRIKIPIAPIEVQQAIVDLFNCAEEAKKIAIEAREKMKMLCPALVQKVING